MTHRKAAGFQQIGSLLREVHLELIISKRWWRKVESIECVRLKRREGPSEPRVSQHDRLCFAACRSGDRRKACCFMNVVTGRSFSR